MKCCSSVSLSLEKYKLKTTMSYIYTHTRMTIIKKIDNYQVSARICSNWSFHKLLVGEGVGGMFLENSIETCILSRVKQITSPGWMHETSARTRCTGKT